MDFEYAQCFWLNHQIGITNGVKIPDLKAREQEKHNVIIGQVISPSGDIVKIMRTIQAKGIFPALLIETGKLVDDPNDHCKLLDDMKAGSFDIWPLRSFRGYDHVALHIESLKKKISDAWYKTEKEIYTKKLREKYPQVNDELAKNVANFDYYYSMSDDINVYHSGQRREQELMAQLTQCDCPTYLNEYWGRIRSLHEDAMKLKKSL